MWGLYTCENVLAAIHINMCIHMCILRIYIRSQYVWLKLMKTISHVLCACTCKYVVAGAYEPPKAATTARSI